jgi:hypothetical protein
MENIIDILKYIGPLIGVFVGWLLARKNENDKIKYSELRQLKRSLYVLLEIRNQISLTKRMDKYLNILVDKLNIILSNYTEEKIQPDQYKALLKHLLPSIIGENIQKDLMEQFSKCIDNLSEIDPILAYRINGKQNVQDYIQSWEDETKVFFELESVEDIQSVIEHFRPTLIDEIKGDIESIIIDIAVLISKKEVEKVKDILKEPEDLEIEIDIESNLEKIFNGILD